MRARFKLPLDFAEGPRLARGGPAPLTGINLAVAALQREGKRLPPPLALWQLAGIERGWWPQRGARR